jgi:hypothetical protein
MKTLTSIAIVALFIFSALIINLPADTEAAQGKKDAGGYQYTDGLDPEPKVECSYIDVSGNSAHSGLDTNDWDALLSVNLPFAFTYYGSSYSKIYVSTYGAMSFVDSSKNNYANNIWGGHPTIPNGATPRGIIAVYYGYYSQCQDTTKNRLVTLSTKVDGEDAFIVEWNPTQGGKFEAILFKSGTIKFQYQSVPTSGGATGSYALIGIERQDDAAGVQYLDFEWWRTTDAFPLPFAIIFHRDDISLTDGRLENGDGSDHSMIYPGSKDYIFSVDVLHTSSWDSILSVVLTLGPGDEGIRFAFTAGAEDEFVQLSGMDYAELVPALSKVEPGKDGLSGKVTFAVNLFLTYPSEEDRNFTFFATGRSAVPIRFTPEYNYRVERELKWSSDTVMIRLDSGVRVDYDGYVPGKARINFYNLKVYYDKSQVQPRVGVVMINVTEQSGLLKREKIAQGKSLDCDWITSDITSTMIFTISISEIEVPKVCILSEPITFQIKVDTNPPSGLDPNYFKVYPDVLGEHASTIDDDYRVYLSWEDELARAEDAESGIGGYRIEAAGPGYYRVRETTLFSYYLGNKVGDELPEGRINVSVRAFDKVGNLGPRLFTTLVIDRSGPTYQLAYPLPGEWVKLTKPSIKVTVLDPLSGIDTFNLTYRASKDGGYTWGDWQNCDYNGYGSPERTVTLEPTLIEGRNNVVEIRGFDLAHSEETTAQFQILVDPRAPKISLVDIPIEADGKTTAYLPDPSDPIRVSIHDYIGSGLDMSRLTFRYSTDNGTTFSADIPIDAEPFNNSQGFTEVQYNIRKDWEEGDGNLLVIDAGDNVGRNVTAMFRIRIDMTPQITIYRPLSGSTFLDNQTIRFDADVIDLDMTPGMSVSWVSNVQGPLGSASSITAVLQAGEHIITLVVKDKAHVVTRTFMLNIKSYLLENPYLKDTDGDGMSDGYEDDYAPDPLVVGSKGLDKDRNDALEDLDGDGYTNLKESRAGTNPLLKTSHPGSTLEEEKFPVLAVIIMVAGIALVMLMGILTVMESRRTPEYAPIPRYPQGLPPYYRGALMPAQMPRLPPAPPQYRPPQ